MTVIGKYYNIPLMSTSVIRTWDTHNLDFGSPEIEAAVEEVKEEYNGSTFEQLASNLPAKQTDESGIEYAIISGESKTDAFYRFNQFGNGIDPNMLLQADFTSRVIQKLGIRDENGDTVPFYVESAPVNASTVELSRRQRKMIAAGDFMPLGGASAELMKSHGIGRVALIGHSLGANRSLATAIPAISRDIDVRLVAAMDPASTVDKNPLELLYSFAKTEADLLPQAVLDGGMEAFKEWHGLDGYEQVAGSISGFIKGILGQAAINLALYRGLAKGTLPETLQEVVAAVDAPISLAHMQESHISDSDAMVEAVANVTYQLPRRHPVELVTITNASHASGDIVPVQAGFFAHAAKRIAT